MSSAATSLEVGGGDDWDGSGSCQKKMNSMFIGVCSAKIRIFTITYTMNYVRICVPRMQLLQYFIHAHVLDLPRIITSIGRRWTVFTLLKSC